METKIGSPRFPRFWSRRLSRRQSNESTGVTWRQFWATSLWVGGFASISQKTKAFLVSARRLPGRRVSLLSVDSRGKFSAQAAGCGGIWSRDKARKAADIVDEVCPLCLAKADSVHHRGWCCLALEVVEVRNKVAPTWGSRNFPGWTSKLFVVSRGLPSPGRLVAKVSCSRGRCCVGSFW